ncbi:MAG: AMP-binding protein [Alphaproteobacteria bacterium]|nr:AMP-binding protein [Alphaproteobacteria bacterium]
MDHDLYRGCSMGDLLLHAIRRFPDRVLMVHGGRQITYRDFARTLSQLLQALESLGLRRGDGLVQLSANRPEAFMVQCACYMLGLRYTPLHPLGSVEDHAFIAHDSEARALVVDERGFASRAAEIAAGAPGLAHILAHGPAAGVTDLFALAAGYAPKPLRVAAREDDHALLVYTGGTTGRPKGVLHLHRSMVMNAMMTLAEWEWPREVRLLAATPITHAVGAMMVPTMLRGSTVILQEGFEPAAFLDAVARHRVTATFLVPTMIYVLLDHPSTRQTDLSSLQLVIYGAAPMSPSRLREAIGVFGPVFMQLYAQSEAPNTVTALRISDHDPDRAERLASCGSPLAGIQVAILDENGRECPQGEVGEICVRGPLVMEGYWKRPEETEKAFRHGWLHTGDMAYRDADDFYYIVDRLKDMIVSGGFNVFPREVEDVLTAHPAVAMAAVIGVPDEKWGEAVKAVIVRKPGASVTEEELIRLVRERKGPVHAPKSVDFAETIPVTALGKPDKKAVRARYWGARTRQVN